MPAITRLDEVEVHSLDAADGPLIARLTFRVGAVDETVSTLGLSHLVEHVALDGVDGLEPDVNGESRMTYTAFQVKGTPEVVVRRLGQICSRIADLAIGRLPVTEVDRSRRVLLAERGGPMGDQIAAEHLHVRLGATGFGLGAVPARFTARFSAEEASAWAGEHFTAGNAVLALSGPVPEGLRLPLPAGARRTPPDTPALDHSLPGEYLSGAEEPSLSFVAPDILEAPAATAVLLGTLRSRVFRRLRQETGIVYDIAPDVAVVGRRGVVVVAVRCSDRDAVAAMEGVLSILRDLRDGGVTDAEREQAALEFAEARAETTPFDALCRDADDALLGWPPLTQVGEQDIRAVRDEDLAALLAQLERTLLVGFGPGSRTEEEVLAGDTRMLPRAERPDGPAIEGEQFRPGLMVRMGGLRLRCTVGERGLGLDLPDGRVGVLWEEVVAWSATTDEDGIDVVSIETLDGGGGDIPVGLMKHGDRLRSLLLANLPERLRLPDDV
ncbi:insulinase family protein [Micrococcus sp.]|uniref:insulinase family protein n=1 Tax=Micrococcus sp. TaxID=1271 RepID=UPI0026DC26F9|nr:insulinase family protein [Micrococcus sp.]MDO4238995.1 insulinase family protein [Micrococcus sp.]